MDGTFIRTGRSHRNAQSFTNSHDYRYELFNTVTNLEVQDLNNCSLMQTQLLLCVACLNPQIVAFNKEKMLSLVEF